MPSNQGHENTGSAGNDGDEAAWLDLVARLEAPEFMDELLDSSPEEPKTRSAEPSNPKPAPDHKGVVDFDPLGVWEDQSEPAPREAELHQVSGENSTEIPSGPRDYDAEDPDESFVPEDLPSLAGTAPAVVLSWIGAVGGPLFLVIAAIFWRSIPLPAVLGVIAAFLAGTGYLLFRLPNNRDHDSGDGAVV
ncbi:hypothetical protein [Arthrobacter sp. GMC3]|uniref:hypothetical protein n=1 Tax=Arthrobacter sp. GMC3 TaxID=2058894 RepID=UPI000CE562F2|nr:hypothetical protein [Arthrobacter sp. GMC3]